MKSNIKKFFALALAVLAGLSNIFSSQPSAAVEFEKEIKDMKPGDSGYTVPWALDINRRNEARLNPNFTVHEEIGGTVCMKVTRTTKGYLVETPQKYKFDCTENPQGVPVLKVSVSRDVSYF